MFVLLRVHVVLEARAGWVCFVISLELKVMMDVVKVREGV